MKLIIFCHQNEAYLVPNKIAELVKRIDKSYHLNLMTIDEDTEALKFLKSIKEKYQNIPIGHLLTGDLG
jgi:hypothetical protein